MNTSVHPSGRMSSENGSAGFNAYTQRPVPRSLALTILRTALTLGEIRFARQVALNWLTAYPGDLPVRLLHAATLMQPLSGSGKNSLIQAVPILESLAYTDPEFLPALEALQRARCKAGLDGDLSGMGDLCGMIFALGGSCAPSTSLPEWAPALKQARQALVYSNDHYTEMADSLVAQALLSENPPILAAVTHLQVETRKGAAPSTIINLAESYSHRWPDCLQVSLALAHALIEQGEADRGVDLLHQAVVRDITGQAPVRMWGEKHPYLSLWPSDMEAAVLQELAVPASIAASLGWNRLPARSTAETFLNDIEEQVYDFVEEEAVSLEESEDEAALVAFLSELFPESAVVVEELAALDPDLDTPLESEPEAPPPAAPRRRQRRSSSRRGEPASSESTAPAPESLRSVQVELERVAAHIKKPQLARTDGRFPVYVVFSTRRGLEAQYGPGGASQIEEAMLRLVESVSSRKYWGAMLFYGDDPSSRGGSSSPTAHLKPARANDPWSLKLAIADLDSSLAKQGEMIGALLIVGGPDVVPFHRLPNPVDDDDVEVASDNPYTTRDENYFVPEWPTGRIPGGSGNDPSFLVEALNAYAAHHFELAKGIPWYRTSWEKVIHRFLPSMARVKPSLAYSAAIWRRASLSVYRPIGEARSMQVSPPSQARNILAELDDFHSSDDHPAGRANGNGSGNGNGRGNGGGSGSYMPFFLYPVRMGYFNLHGLSDAPEWYGQSDPFDPHAGIDYPVALRPDDIEGGSRSAGRLVPQVVFSEACYGAHIDGRRIDDSVALKFLSKGTQAVVGSTCIAYGAINTPLIGADLLGYSFWHYLSEGLPAGEALRRAKIRLAREMHRRQGYLDGEDQKTLISFVLYGDPLAQPHGSGRGAKTVLRPQAPPSTVKVVCDRCEDSPSSHSVPSEVLSYVRNIVEQYLPGMEGAQLSYAHEHVDCQSASHSCPTSQMGAKSQPAYAPERQVVTLAKQVRHSKKMHKHYARLTLDHQGKLVKLVVSR